MKSQFLYFLFILIVFVSCKKEGSDYVKGTVFEDGSNTPLAGILVTLYEDKRSASNVVVDRVITNSMGEYSIKYNKLPGREYIVKCSELNYVTADNPTGIEIKSGREAHNFVLIPIAYVKLRYIKTTSANLGIMGRVNGEFFVSPLPATPTTVLQPYDSIKKEIKVVFGSRPNIIKWGSIVPFEQQAPYDGTLTERSFSVPKGDTLTYTITFD